MKEEILTLFFNNIFQMYLVIIFKQIRILSTMTWQTVFKYKLINMY